MGTKRKPEVDIVNRKRQKVEKPALVVNKKKTEATKKKIHRDNGHRKGHLLKHNINNSSNLHGKTVSLSKTEDKCGSHGVMNQSDDYDLRQSGPDKRKQLQCALKTTEAAKQSTTKLKSKQKKKIKKKKKNTGENTNISSEQNVESSKIDKIHLPTTADEYSANWKQLMQTLESTKKKTSKVRQKPTRVKLFKHSQKNEDKKVAAPVEKRSAPDIWFDDVDAILLEDSRPKDKPVSVGDTPRSNPLVKPESFEGLTKVIAMDCEMVGVGSNGKDNMLARASIVNQYGQCVYDKYVKPREEVTDYRTDVSGIRPKDFLNAEEFSTVQTDISNIFQGRILVGHAIHNDLQVLYLDHPRKTIRDTQQYKPFRKLFQGRLPSLKKLTEKVLNVAVQEGEHNSVQDAQATMRLYTMYRKRWEKEIKEKQPRGISKVRKAKKKARRK